MQLIKIGDFNAKVDDEDFYRISQYKWRIIHGYAVTGYHEDKISMQHVVLGFAPGSRMRINRKNKNRLDNQKLNLLPNYARPLREYEINRESFAYELEQTLKAIKRGQREAKKLENQKTKFRKSIGKKVLTPHNPTGILDILNKKRKP